MRMAELAMDADNERDLRGHNNPPEPTLLERAADAMQALSIFLDATPVITEGPHLVEAKRLVEWARGAMAELEVERDGLVRPLNDEVAHINGKYKAIHNADSKRPGTFDKVLNELKSRLTAYAVAEEAERARKADALRIAAEQAEATARAAEAAELQAKQDAVVGVIDTGVADKIAAADQAFAEYETASRAAAIAERDIAFRLGGRTKAIGMRNVSALQLDSYSKAIRAIGPNDKIREAILSAARDYKKLHGSLPDGVSEIVDRRF